MLPDWDFGGDDAKRRAFVAWVEAELDRFCFLVTRASESMATAALPAFAPTPPAHRPIKAMDGTNGLIWDYLLTRYMFDRYWPGLRRALDDPAHAMNIAVARNLHNTEVAKFDARNALERELKRGLRSVYVGPGKREKSHGRQLAEADIAILDALPATFFAA